MVRTTIYLDDETAAALKSMAKRLTKSQAQIIREALHACAKRNHLPSLPTGIGMFDSGYADTSGRRKDLLRERAQSRRWRS